MDIHIREQPLPGIGRRYELVLDAERSLSVIVQHGGSRHIVVIAEGADEPELAIRLDHEQAVALATLLLGARLTVGTADDDGIGAEEVVIETVTLGSWSPVVGQLPKDIRLPDDAAVLAVISDATPELVEDPTTRPCQAGDRVVVAVRRRHLDDVVQKLVGSVA
jgi:K+/H+ antiporter YhaU regulatory subunit KhtT